MDALPRFGFDSCLRLLGGCWRGCVNQITQSHLAPRQHLDLQRFLKTDAPRTPKPVVDLANTDGRLERLRKGAHRDAAIEKVLAKLH